MRLKMIALAMAASVFVFTPAPAEAKRRDCAKIHHTTENIARCHIYRAAKKYDQPVRDAVRVARCESNFRWWISGHHQGMYQFLYSTWATTPYAKKSPHSAKWNSLAAMWMWAHGRRGEWACR